MKHVPVWEDLLSPAGRTVLDRGTTSDVDPAPDVLVVGGGVAGLCVAWALARGGVQRVQVLERGRLAGGVSGSAAGLLAPDLYVDVRDDAFVALGRRGLELHREIDTADSTGFRDIDVVPAGGAAAIRGQGHVDPLRFAAGLARRSPSTVTGTEVGHVRSANGALVVSTSRGDLRAGAVVFATGSPPPGTAGGRARLVKGHLIATEAPVPSEPSQDLAAAADGSTRTAVASDVFAIPLADGRFVAGGTIDSGSDPRPDGAVVARITARLADLVPEAAGRAVTHGWCCFRPAVADERPVIDRHPVLDRVWMVCGLYRNGILLGPAVGEAIAAWVTSGRRPPLAASFAWDRPSLRPRQG